MSDGEHKQALPAGYELQGYRLVRVLGVGGFGVTYLAENVSLGSLVAIKEYLPNEFAVRAGETVHPSHGVMRRTSLGASSVSWTRRGPWPASGTRTWCGSWTTSR